MEKNLIGRLKVMKELGIKPNFSALQREFKVDRHTIKKYYDNDGVPIRKSVHRKSLWDPYEEEINDLMNKLGVTKKSVFYYMKNKYGDAFPGTYDGFKAYTLRKDIKCREESVAHVLYETDPGEQLQFDWKENIKIHLKNKKEITFNVFSATLGYSREHVFIYSLTKTTEDLIRCLIETYRRLGGVTETAITDNMSAIIAGKNRKINPKVNQLMKDLGVNLKLCKPKVPQTKARPIPVLPLVGSIITESLSIFPLLKASKIIAFAILSFALPAGLKYSSFAQRRAFSPYFFSNRTNSTVGVCPTKSIIDFTIFIAKI